MLKYILILFISFLSAPAFAVIESIAPLPAPSTKDATSGFGANYSGSPTSDTAQGACDAYMTQVVQPSNQTSTLHNVYSPPNCVVYDAFNTQVGFQTIVTKLICSQGYDLSGSTCTKNSNHIPDCPSASPPYSYNSTSQMCEREAGCPPAGSAVGSQGYIATGTSPYSMPPRACDSGCGSQYAGSGDKFSRLVDGVKQYYVYGGYVAKAGTCTEGEGNPYAAPALDADGCSSEQSKITMGGKTKCLDSDGKNTNPNSASAVADTKALDDAARAAAINAASAAAAAAGLSASGVAAAAAGAAANYGGGGGFSGKGKDPVMSAYCQQNPTDKACADEEFGEVEDSEITNQDKPVAITPVAIGSAGSCPAPSTMVIHGQTHYFSWETYCNFATGIKPIILVFAWLSAAGILIGGFKE